MRANPTPPLTHNTPPVPKNAPLKLNNLSQQNLLNKINSEMCQSPLPHTQHPLVPKNKSYQAKKPLIAHMCPPPPSHTPHFYTKSPICD